MEKIVFVILDEKDFNDTIVMQKLNEFHVDKARCFDPNEQTKLNQVISGIGKDIFNNKI